MSKVGEKSTSRFGKLNTPKLGKKITQQPFKTKLAFVDVDIEREWPELRGAGIQEGLYNEVVRTRGQPVSHLVSPNLTFCESEDLISTRLNVPAYTRNVWISCTDILIKRRRGIWKASGWL
jgi:hypothetical protein